MFSIQDKILILKLLIDNFSNDIFICHICEKHVSAKEIQNSVIYNLARTNKVTGHVILEELGLVEAMGQLGGDLEYWEEKKKVFELKVSILATTPLYSRWKLQILNRALSNTKTLLSN